MLVEQHHSRRINIELFSFRWNSKYKMNNQPFEHTQWKWTKELNQNWTVNMCQEDYDYVHNCIYIFPLLFHSPSSFVRIFFCILGIVFLCKTWEEVNAHGWMMLDCWRMMMKKRIKERKTCYSDSVILYHRYLQSFLHFHISVGTLTLSINFNNSPFSFILN